MSTDWRARLTAAGFREGAIDRASDAFERISQIYVERCGGLDEAKAWWVPGRIEVLGKHTDYGGGRSLICAVERGLHLLASPRTDGVIRIIDASSGNSWTGNIRSALHPAPGEWFDYPSTVARRIARDFPGSMVGMDVVFLSSIPRAAGLSSSSALVIAAFLPLSEFNKLSAHPRWRAEIPDSLALAGYLGSVENGLAFGSFGPDFGVGTHGGSEDHTAILCSRAGQLSSYHYLPVTFESSAELEADWTFVVASSGVHAAKAGAVRQHYNRLSEQLRRLLNEWKSQTGSNAISLMEAMQEKPDAVAELREMIAPLEDSQVLIARLDQFRDECEVIIPSVLLCLAARDLTGLGMLIDRSQHLAETVLGNQIPETIHLAHSARRLGAVAASAFGAGFGGSVWALTTSAEAPSFMAKWRDEYRRHFPDRSTRSEFFMTRPGPSATRI